MENVFDIDDMFYEIYCKDEYSSLSEYKEKYDNRRKLFSKNFCIIFKFYVDSKGSTQFWDLFDHECVWLWLQKSDFASFEECELYITTDKFKDSSSDPFYLDIAKYWFKNKNNARENYKTRVAKSKI